MKQMIVYNTAATVYLTVAGDLDLLTRHEGAPTGNAAPLLFDTSEEADSYVKLTQDGGRAVPYER